MFADLWIRLRSLFHRRAVENELDDELRFHFDQQVEKFVESGLPLAEARRRARLTIGGHDQIKEEYRDSSGVRFLETLWQDLCYGLRMLRKSPGFTAVAVLTLALGIGATTAIFSVVNGVILRPLPFPNPSRLMILQESLPAIPEMFDSYLNFRDWERQQHSFSGLGFYRYDRFNLSWSSGAEVVSARIVSPSFFAVLGVAPFRGREFTTSDNHLGAAPTAVLGYNFWQRRYGGNPDLVGKSLVMDDRDYQVIGVLPKAFSSLEAADVYVPAGIYNASWKTRRDARFGSQVVGRLKPGVSLSRAQADMTTIARSLAQQYPETDAGVGVTVQPLVDYIVKDVRAILYLLLGAVCLVLLIACINMANLLLSRGAVREKEMAIRAALGARPGRVIRQLLTEGVLLAVLGGGLGILLAFLATRGLLAYVPGELPRAQDVGLDLGVLLFTVAVSVTAGLLFALAPAFRSAQTDFVGSLREGGRGSTGRWHGLQNSLVVAEVGLALVLMIGAGLTLRTVLHLDDAPTGFRTSGALVFGLSLPPAHYHAPAANRQFYRELTDRLSHLPGVKAVGTVWDMPMLSGAEFVFYRQGKTKPQLQDMPLAIPYFTSPGYLRAMGIGLLRGRFFTDKDTLQSQPVVVIDSALAHEFFPGQDPIGQQIVVPIKDTEVPREIVGVVHHVKQFGPAGLKNWKVNDAFYIPMAQVPDQFYRSVEVLNLTLVVRTSVSAQSMAASVRGVVQGIESGAAVSRLYTIGDLLRLSLAAQRFTALLFGIFAALALALAAIGTYGVISYWVARRTHEIGIRMALGAQRRDVMRLVIGQGALLVGIGILIGIGAALGLTRLMAGLLYGVKPTDPLTFAAVVILLLGVALAACYVPARHAMKVDPMVALRHE
jgi:putative ABC transport system permease protein